jgi:hypothetical protein
MYIKICKYAIYIKRGDIIEETLTGKILTPVRAFIYVYI